MKLYAYGTDDGRWYQGRSPSGRVKECDSVTDAAFFTEDTKDDAADCIELGYNCYSMELGAPVLEQTATQPKKPTTSDFDYQSWEVYPMNLFGPKSGEK